MVVQGTHKNLLPMKILMPLKFLRNGHSKDNVCGVQESDLYTWIPHLLCTRAFQKLQLVKTHYSTSILRRLFTQNSSVEFPA